MKGVYKMLYTANSSPKYNNGQTIGPIWFLLALFWGRLYFACILKYARRYHFFLCMLATYVVYEVHEIINPPAGLLTGANALLFISMGYYFRKSGINIIFLIISLALYPYTLQNSGLDMAHVSYVNMPLAIIGGLAGTFIAFLCAMLMSKFFITKYFSIFGKYSIQVLCWHYLIFFIFVITLLWQL